MTAAIRTPQIDSALDPADASAEEVAALCSDLAEIMDHLIATVEAETDYVKAGRLAEAGALSGKKSQLSIDYTAKMLLVKKNAAAMQELAAEDVAQLKRKNTLFRAVLKINLGALGAARSVSSEIMETLAIAVGKQKKTSGYGANAQLPQRDGFVSEGIALDRGI